MDQAIAKAVAWAIVGARLAYWNTLLAGMSGSILDKLKRAQSCLAQVVKGANAVETTSNKFLKTYTGFQANKNQLQDLSTRSEQATPAIRSCGPHQRLQTLEETSFLIADSR